MNENSLSCLILDCTVKPSPHECYTDRFIEQAKTILHAQGVSTEVLRPVDFDISHLLSSDPQQQNVEDDWPQIAEKIYAADMLLLCSPTWLANVSSVAIKVLERLYSQASRPNRHGQYIFFNRAAGVLMSTEDEDCLTAGNQVLRCLINIGFVTPPELNKPWIDPAPADLAWPTEKHKQEEKNNVHTMTWNLIRMARKIKRAGSLYEEAAHA